MSDTFPFSIPQSVQYSTAFGTPQSSQDRWRQETRAPGEVRAEALSVGHQGCVPYLNMAEIRYDAQGKVSRLEWSKRGSLDPRWYANGGSEQVLLAYHWTSAAFDADHGKGAADRVEYHMENNGHVLVAVLV